MLRGAMGEYDFYKNYAARSEEWSKVWLAAFDWQGSRVWKKRNGDRVRVLVTATSELEKDLPSLSKMPPVLRGLHPRAPRAERTTSVSTTIGELPARWFPNKLPEPDYAPLPNWVWVELD